MFNLCDFERATTWYSYSVHDFEDAEKLGATYTFEKAFDVGVNNLESLGVLGQLFFYFFRSEKQGLQVRPRPLNFLKYSEHITAGNGKRQRCARLGAHETHLG